MRYKNDLYPADLNNVPKTIWELGNRFGREAIEEYDEEKPLNPENTIASNPILVRKFLYVGFETGARIGELIRRPGAPEQGFSIKCKLTQMEKQGKLIDVMVVQKQNEKHFTNAVPLDPNATPELDSKGHAKRMRRNLELSEREVITQYLPLDNDYEVSMWRYITGRDRLDMLNTEQSIDFSPFGGYAKRTGLTHYISDHFTLTMTDGNKIYADEGLLPHHLRHLRAYNLLLEKGLTDVLVQSYMGWDNRDMIEHYVYIRKMMSAKQQLELLKGQLKVPGGEMPRYK